MTRFSLRNLGSDRLIIYTASFLRSLGIGLIGILLAIYLMQLDLSKTQVGVVVSVGLLGAAFGNFLVTFFGDRIGRKKTLVMYALLSAAGAIALCLSSNFYTILITAFFGMLNARGKDRGAALVIETAIIPSFDEAKNRTRSFALYSLVQDIGLAIGGVAAGLPTVLSTFAGVPSLTAFRFTFALYAGCMILMAFLYLYLSNSVEVPLEKLKIRLSSEGKKIMMKVGSIIAIDSLAGGFLTSALLSYYFYERFHVSLEVLGIFFFIARLLNAASYLGATWLSKRFGLLNALVFTHTPSSLILIAAAFAPTFPIAAALFLLRETLVEMDVPTRQSYLMAVVKPEERTMISGIALIVRMLGWAVGPAIAGFVMQYVSNTTPLFIGAGMKITYDMCLYFSFRNVKPPEEPAEVAPEPKGQLATA